MTRGLERWYGGHDLHFITCSCYRRRPQLDSGERRDLFLHVLERARQKYRFVVIGYVVMPEHFHLLITEPEVGNPSVVMKVVKERFTKLLHHGGVHTGPIWQKRFYDFNVCSTEKRVEKLRGPGPPTSAVFAFVGVVDASQSCEARSGNSPRRLEME
jgi:putative transposase